MDAAQSWAIALGSWRVEPDHVGLALCDTEPSLVRALGLEPRVWLGQTIMWLGYQRGAAAMQPRGPTATVEASAGLNDLLAATQWEADRNGNEPDARHLVVALLRIDESTASTHARQLGANAAAARRALGLRAFRRPLAAGHERRSARVPLDPSLVLLSGGAMTDALPAAVEAAKSMVGVSSLRVGVIGATNPHGGERTAQRLRSLGVDATDLRVNDRDQADKAKLDETLHAVYFPGGDPARGYDALWATRLYFDLVAFAEAGGVVMGHSAGATIWGSGHSSWFVSEGDLEPLPMFGWLGNTVVVAHHLDDRQRLQTARTLFPGQQLLALGHEGAVAIEHGTVREIAPGETSTLLVTDQEESTVSARAQPLAGSA